MKPSIKKKIFGQKLWFSTTLQIWDRDKSNGWEKNTHVALVKRWRVRAWFWTEKTGHGKTMTCRVRLWKLWCYSTNWCQLRIFCCWKEASESPELWQPQAALAAGGSRWHQPWGGPPEKLPHPSMICGLKEDVEVCSSGGRGSGTEAWESSGERLLFVCSALLCTLNYQGG